VSSLWICCGEPRPGRRRPDGPHLHVRLRKALLPAADLIVTRQPGYLLRLDPDSVDAARFERLTTAGRQSLEAGRPDVAVGQLTAALGLWHGEAYEEFAASPS